MPPHSMSHHGLRHWAGQSLGLLFSPTLTPHHHLWKQRVAALETTEGGDWSSATSPSYGETRPAAFGDTSTRAPGPVPPLWVQFQALLLRG